MVNIFDPMTGKTESKVIELFDKVERNFNSDNITEFIDPGKVKQIIMVNFDESKSMIGDIEGYIIRQRSSQNSRLAIATQYITTFISRTFGYKIFDNQLLLGLISFNDKVSIRSPLSPFISDFEDEGLPKISPNSTTKLWDSIMLSCNEIVKLRKGKNGQDMYNNAISRILVISDGDDTNSTAKVEDVVKELIKNKIIVDSVIISSEDECQMLCAVSHATGGCSFKPTNEEEGISLFENSAFINIKERKIRKDPLIDNDRKTTPSRIKLEMITNDFMNKAKSCAKFDEEVVHIETSYANKNSRLATPLNMIARNDSVEIKESRMKRILKELRIAYRSTSDDSEYESYFCPEIKVFTLHSNLDKWKVFVKSPEGSFYGEKWWYLYVTFPDCYPIDPPSIRFITVPYHLNVSEDGQICFNYLQQNYSASMSVFDIIQSIREIFLIPCLDSPIQIKIYGKYLNDRYRYEKFARRSAKKAKDDYKEFLSSTDIDDEVPSDFKFDIDAHCAPPPYMRSDDACYRKPIDEKYKVKASSCVYYDRRELKELIASSKKPICVVTGKVLAEKLEDFDFDSDSDSDTSDNI